MWPLAAAVGICIAAVAQAQFFGNPPTRPVDLWNPFGTTTTRRPGMEARGDEVIVKLGQLGNIVGRRVTLPNLPWASNHDPLDQIPETRSHLELDPVPRRNNVSVIAFLGLPYAEPPTAQRRFKPPQRLTVLPRDDPYPAFEYAASCPQDIETRPTLFVNDPYPWRISEDCLYLNVFTPETSKTSQNIYPVVVFFHGGNFQTGSANEWPGHVLASRGLVVVTVNYRLGPFGFMSLGDWETANRGIKDQRLALMWVQDYIASFGGDPQAVTIVGHDAGAVSAGIHMLAYESKHLFRSVAAMSGAEVSYHSIIGKPALAYNNTMKLGRYLGCTQAMAQNVWDCILTRSSNDIIQAVSPTNVPTIPIEYNRYLFMPTVDGRELKAHPLWLLNNVPNGAADLPSSVPYLTGLNHEDGVEVILEDRTLGEFTDFLEVDQSYLHSFVIEYAFRHNYTMNKEAIVEAIESFYTYWPDPADVWRIREKFIELTTDAYYTSPIALSAHLHSNTGSRTFMYVNNYNFSENRQNTPDPAPGVFPAWMGACHDCDLYLLFGFPFMPKELLPPHYNKLEWYDVDRNASQLFSSMFLQFFKYSDPNLPYDATWTAHQPRAHWYLDFNYTAWTELRAPGVLKRDYRYEQVAFWNNFIPSLVNYMTTTFAPEEVRVRRELMAFHVIVAVVVLIMMIVLVIALSLGYQLCTRDRRMAYEHRQLVSAASDNYPSNGDFKMQRISSL